MSSKMLTLAAISVQVLLSSSVVQGQAQDSKKEDEHDAMSVLTVTDKNWVKKIMHGGE